MVWRRRKRFFSRKILAVGPPPPIKSYPEYLKIVDSTTSSSEAQVASYCYLLSRNLLQDYQCIGLIANAVGESAMNPAILGDHGSALGLFQWHAARQRYLFAFASALKLNPRTRTVQLAFALHEMGIGSPLPVNLRKSTGFGSEINAGTMLKRSRNLSEAVANVIHYYERSADQSRDRVIRTTIAQELLVKARQVQGIPADIKGITTITRPVKK